MKPHTLIKVEIHLNEIHYLEIRDVSRGVLLFVDRYGIPNSYPKLVKNQIYLNQPYKMNTMSNIIYKYIIITFSIVNNKFLYERKGFGQWNIPSFHVFWNCTLSGIFTRKSTSVSFSYASKTLFNLITPRLLSESLNNSYPWHSYMFVTENYSSKILIMSFWVPAPKFPAENGIPKKLLDTSLLKRIMGIKEITKVLFDFMKAISCKNYLGLVNSEILRDLILLKILNFWVTDINFMFSIVNTFLNIMWKKNTATDKILLW